jgi:hypothetical protein
VKIQNDCSQYFENRQGLRQGDVLESIVRRAKLQTNGNIFNKQTQILGYTDDIDIIGRSQAANKVGLIINENNENERTIRRSLVTPNNDVSLEIQMRIQTANRSFFGLRKINHLQDHDPPDLAVWQLDMGVDQKGGV